VRTCIVERPSIRSQTWRETRLGTSSDSNKRWRVRCFCWTRRWAHKLRSLRSKSSIPLMGTPSPALTPLDTKDKLALINCLRSCSTTQLSKMRQLSQPLATKKALKKASTSSTSQRLLTWQDGNSAPSQLSTPWGMPSTSLSKRAMKKRCKCRSLSTMTRLYTAILQMSMKRVSTKRRMKRVSTKRRKMMNTTENNSLMKKTKTMNLTICRRSRRCTLTGNPWKSRLLRKRSKSTMTTATRPRRLVGR